MGEKSSIHLPACFKRLMYACFCLCPNCLCNLSRAVAADKLVKSIRRKTRQTYSSEEKIRIVLAGLRGEESISAMCRREGIAESLYYSWSKEFLEAGKRRLSGDTARQATSPEVKDLRSESLALKECVADLTLENRLLKKSMTGNGDYEE